MRCACTQEASTWDALHPEANRAAGHAPLPSAQTTYGSISLRQSSVSTPAPAAPYTPTPVSTTPSRKQKPPLPICYEPHGKFISLFP